MEFHFTEELRDLAKTRPADVSAIGVSILIDHITDLEQENASLREELQKLKRKEKPIRFGSLADWGRE